jgi:tetratricopeptide (TPR) repeat protein
LSGIDDVADSDTDPAEAEKLRKLLYSDDVNEFLKQADETIKSGSSLDWDVVSKAANLHYYRTYFEKDKKDEQEERAKEWLLRALLMNPLHADLTAKYADVLGRLESYSEAVAVLEKLYESEEGPTYIQQWLGYFLLFVPNRDDDAIQMSLDYLKRFQIRRIQFSTRPVVMRKNTSPNWKTLARSLSTSQRTANRRSRC